MASAARAALNVRFAHVSILHNEWRAFHAYFAPINATVVSNIRLLKPHSLSYQLETLTRLPDTLVRVASKVDEWLS